MMWTYHDATGKPVGLVVRWNLPNGGKDIRPVARQADAWQIGAMPEPRPLYRLPEVLKASRVIVCEGEKAADAARSLGFTATTSAGGAQAAGKTDWRPMAGKEVWLLPDNDLAGRKYDDTAANFLLKLSPATVMKIIELPGLPEGGDIVDWIDAHGDAAEPETMRAEIEALARYVEPIAINSAANNEAQFQPFPVDALPEPIQGFVVAGAKAIGCDQSYLALPLLVELAAAIGNTRRLELKRGWSAPAILWGAIVGESGTAKTPAFKLVMRPARDRQRKALELHAEAMKLYEADFAQWEKEFAAWKRVKNETIDPPAKPDQPQSERFIVSDTTVEALAPILLENARGVLLARDELAGWIGSFDRYSGKGKASADAANWLSMFNAESFVVDRKTGIPRTIYVPHAAVCVTGGIQPGILKRALGEEHRESGLAARLLLTCPPRKPKMWTDADIDPKAEAALALLFDRLYELQPTQGDEGEIRSVQVVLDARAKSSWTEYYNVHAKEQASLIGDLSAAWSKLEEYAARLALVVHFTRWAANDPLLSNPNLLDAASMAAGIKLATWFKGEALRIYAMLAESDAEKNLRRLVEWIELKKGSTTAREVQQGCRWLKAPGAAESALEELVKAGRGTWQYAPTTVKGGRPSRVFVRSTSSTVYDTPITHIEKVSFVDVDNVDAAVKHPNNPDGNGLFHESRGLPD